MTIIKFLAISLFFCVSATAQTPSLDAIMNYAKIENLTTNTLGNTIAWVANYQGERNIFVAKSPAFNAKQYTFFTAKDEQEISNIQITSDGKYAVFVRGGDHGGFLYKTANNTLSLPTAPKITIWSVVLDGSNKPIELAEGDNISLSSDNKTIAYIKNGELWQIQIDGSQNKKLIHDLGNCSDVQWSPNGEKLAFVSNRDGHSFIGIYTDSITPITYLSPSFFYDNMPKWSDDGQKIAFIRTINTRSDRDSILLPKPDIWEIWVCNLKDGLSHKIYKSQNTLQGGTKPTTSGGFNLKWLGKELSFLSYQDGWPHLYSLSENGGKETCLTPGNYMVEYPTISLDKKSIFFAANYGKDSLDIDRRHIYQVDLSGKITTITEGKGIEAFPKPLINSEVVYISSTVTTAPIPTILSNGTTKSLISQPNFSLQNDLITPKQVVFQSPDGVDIHAQLFLPKNYKGKIPTVVFAHGGPDRQMYLDWHYSTYYSNCYAINQYLATHGIAVLSVNYRCGIGYGFDFDEPNNQYSHGAIEYNDIKAAGEWLQRQKFVDSKKIGIYGGSYGGYLTALALSRNSDIFSAGVDIHGVHEHEKEEANYKNSNAPDAQLALDTEKKSFAINYVSTWKSPVLLIHGDDDRNVDFGQSIDLAKELMKYKVPFESIIIPNDTHHWMKYSNEQKVNKETVEFLERKLK